MAEGMSNVLCCLFGHKWVWGNSYTAMHRPQSLAAELVYVSERKCERCHKEDKVISEY